MEQLNQGMVRWKGVQLKLVDVNLFYEGLDVSAGIYIQVRDNIVLLCGGVSVTPELIKKLGVIVHAGNRVYVKESEYAMIEQQYEDYIASLDRQKKEDIDRRVSEFAYKMAQVENYQNIAVNAAELLKKISETGAISNVQANEITADIQQSLESSEPSIVLQCVNNIRNVDDYLYSHSLNVAMLNGLFGQWLGCSERESAKLIKVGLLHDIGKLNLPKEILNKPSRLTDAEFAIVKMHPLYSLQTLKDSGIYDEDVLNGVVYHHERMNGTGYPKGLHAEAIPMLAKVTAISDVYDAMVAKRVYKDRHPPFDILRDFSESRFSDLDYKTVTIFLQNMPKVYLNKETMLSDGRIGKIVYISRSDIAHPTVEVDSELIKTTEYLKCMTVSDFL